jgi:RNA polymerase sigma-54 factor
MALGQRLEIRQGQSLVMTPQLQQAIRLLQFSSVELAEYVEAELERNPLLSREEGSADAPTPEPVTEAAEPRSLSDLVASATPAGDMDAPREDMWEADGAADQGSSSQAPEGGPTTSLDWSRTGGGQGFEQELDPDANLTADLTLRAHLTAQADRAAFSPEARLIAQRLIDDTDEGGYLRADLDAVAQELGVGLADVYAVLERCQGFEPTGVMARDVAECLALQLAERNRLDPAMRAMLAHLDLVARRDLRGLRAVCGVDQDDVLDMIAEIRSLTPRPGAGFAGEAAGAVVPDIFVRELPDGAFSVELNPDALPRVLLDKTYYATVVAGARKEEDRQFLTECSANASWLVKSLDQRARTILKVAREIVRQQDMFFVQGVSGLRPLNLKTVAQAIDMHESTVSRATSSKFMATPRGVFELKYFFTASIQSADGGENHSAEAVRHRIKLLIESETPDDVLSDDDLVDRLKDIGIDIARRTVAKYREALRIPSSSVRKRMLVARAG